MPLKLAPYSTVVCVCAQYQVQGYRTHPLIKRLFKITFLIRTIDVPEEKQRSNLLERTC